MFIIRTSCLSCSPEGADSRQLRADTQTEIFNNPRSSAVFRILKAMG